MLREYSVVAEDKKKEKRERERKEKRKKSKNDKRKKDALSLKRQQEYVDISKDKRDSL